MRTSDAKQVAAEHFLNPEPEHLHGWLDPTLPPVLHIEAGDTVVCRTPDAAWNKWPPGTPHDRPVFEPPAGAEIALLGPIHIAGANPGDVLVVQIEEIVPRDWGFGWHKPGAEPPNGILGGESDDIDDVYLRHLRLDRERGVWRWGEGIAIVSRPFMGIMAVAPGVPGRTRTLYPGPYGGNLDCKELVAGTTLQLPVFAPGALFSVGDGHGAQGDGEVDAAGIETAMDRLVLTFSVRRDIRLDGPRAETPTHFVFLAFDEDLDVAARGAVRQVMQFLAERESLSWDDAYNLASLAADLHVTQVVDGLKGVHAMLPKAIFEA